MKFVLILTIICFLIACSNSTESNNIGPCETVVNAQGPGFLKVINNTNSYVDVFLSEYAFSATMRPKVCEIYGMATGSRKIEISLCLDNKCSSLSKTKKVTVSIEDGKTHTIEVTDSYFNN